MALAAMLYRMRESPAGNFASVVRTSDSQVRAQVSAILCRTSEVEAAMIRRNDNISLRARRRLEPVGPDPHYSDTYVPTEVEYLDYCGTDSVWRTLARIDSA